MPKAFLKSAYFKSNAHVQNHIAYLDRQSTVFGLDGDMSVEGAQADVNAHSNSLFWRQVYSMTDDDIERLAVDREYFKNLIMAKRDDIAKNYNISPENLRVVASFHNKDHHPHLHMVMYSTDRREGHLHVHNKAERKKVLNKASVGLKAIFANEIFRGDLAEIKDLKGYQKEQLKRTLEQNLQRVAKTGYFFDAEITFRLQALGKTIDNLPGRKVYGYMPPAVKKEIDQLLRYIIAHDEVAQGQFTAYGQSQKALIETYADHPDTIAKKMKDWEERFYSPQKGDDTARHNAIIKAALQLDTMSTKEKSAHRPVGEYQDKHPANVTQNLIYNISKTLATGARQNEAKQSAAPKPKRNQRGQKRSHNYDHANDFER